MKQRVKDLVDQGDRLFSARSSLMQLWQETANQFYPERADFTASRSLGTEFAAGSMTGFPFLVRRDLANQLATMLRPKGKSWFTMTVGAEDSDQEQDQDQQAKAWLEDKTAVMRRVLYDTRSGFVRSTKEGDNDFTTFGQACLSVELNKLRTGLLFRCWHLRDVAWAENTEQQIDTVHRIWRLAARGLVSLFPKTVDPKVTKLLEKEPNREIKCRHIILPADEYDLNMDPGQRRKAERLPFVSVYVDEEHETVLEETYLPEHPYILPRWQTVSGSQYAHSPATVVALPDARLLQQITLTLLEAGEKAVNPALIAQGDQIQGGVNTYAGGITWVDADYDEKLGEVLRPLDTGARGGLAFGHEMAERYENLITRAFFLDKITLPPVGDKMTATEIQMRNAEFIRASLPLFEPMEEQYNGQLCDKAFDLILRNGGFGSLDAIPDALRGEDVRFQFESPLQQAAGREKATAFQESAQLLAIAAQADPDAVHKLDVMVALTDALEGVGAPAKWLVPDAKLQQIQAAAAQQRQAAATAQTVATGAHLGEQVGNAAQALQAAGLVPQAGNAAPIQGTPNA